MEGLYGIGAWILPAYIGPGAGFALVGGIFVILLILAAAAGVLMRMPIRILRGLRFRRKAVPRGPWRRCLIIGLDGMDPRLATRFIDEGRMPNFARLRQEGTFRELKTTTPAVSPTAWSSFMTGADASHHGIFDFLGRDPRTYAPVLSSAEVHGPRRTLRIGRHRIPVGRPRVRLLRRGIPFWKRLGDAGVFSTILRVPITFPPETFHGVCLSGMCVPDLRGTQGTFTHFTSDGRSDGTVIGGTVIPVRVEGDRIETALPGPVTPGGSGGGDLRAPIRVRLRPGSGTADVEIGGRTITLRPGVYSDWIRVSFRAAPGVRVRGIVRLYLNSIAPLFDMYATPIQIDPERPTLPISHPFVYSFYLSKMTGTFGTLGLAEDTWALDQGVIDEKAFLDQVWLYHEERERMLFDALEKNRTGVCVCVFDATDRIQHVFFRTLDPDHPANRGRDADPHRDVLGDLYARMDRLLGRVLGAIGPETLLIVVSDHGFTQFRRGVNLNAWLHRNGYLSLVEGAREGVGLEGVDWGSTRAYGLGLTGIYLNRKGREREGIVGEEADRLKEEIRTRLGGLVDPKTGQRAVREVYDTRRIMRGPYADDAPDLLVGLEAGYRVSWAGATGKVTEEVFEDNTRAWSGDHCVDPSIVPGVFFCSEAVEAEAISILDIAPTVMALFGQPIPAQMQGRPVRIRAGATTSDDG